jgi:hypothetical protein
VPLKAQLLNIEACPEVFVEYSTKIKENVSVFLKVLVFGGGIRLYLWYQSPKWRENFDRFFKGENHINVLNRLVQAFVNEQLKYNNGKWVYAFLPTIKFLSPEIGFDFYNGDRISLFVNFQYLFRTDSIKELYVRPFWVFWGFSIKFTI